MATEESPGMMVDSIKKFGWDVSNFMDRGELRVIDVFSYRSNTPSESKYYIDQPENLTDISINIERAREGISRLRFVMDSITSLILNAGNELGQQFMQTITGRLKAAKAMGIFALDAGILGEAFHNFLRFIFDGVIEMRITEDEGKPKRQIRVYSLTLGRHDASWHDFQITDNGIKIL